jgi:hypothetical protein
MLAAIAKRFSVAAPLPLAESYLLSMCVSFPRSPLKTDAHALLRLTQSKPATKSRKESKRQAPNGEPGCHH